MIASRVLSFNDPYIYQTAVRAADVEILVTGKGHFQAELAKIDMPRLWMQHGREVMSRVCHVEVRKERAPIFFLSAPNQASMQHSGTEISANELVIYGSDSTHTHLTRGPCSWGSMSVSPEDLAYLGYALVGRHLTVPKFTHVIRPSPVPMSRLLQVHKATVELAKFAPHVLAHSEVARALEQMLLHAMITCVTEGMPIDMGAGTRRRLLVIKRLEEFFGTNYNRPLYLAEICTAIGVSERTLRLCCQEHLGMGPVRYLWLRRMNLSRRALLRANSAVTTVAQIAMDHGFWELGRFSVQYRALFGEAPSRTLRESAYNLSPDDPLALPFFDSA